MKIALGAALAILAGACAQAPPTADTVLVNGKIFTSNAQQPWAQAIAIRGDRIVGVGDDPAIRAQVGPSTRMIDLGGRTVVPGFNDSHQHIGIFPQQLRLKLSEPEPTAAEVESQLAEVLKTAAPGQWIRGIIGQTVWGDPKINRDWLDAKAPKNPVWLINFTGHGVLSNSAGFAAVDIGDDIQNPDGGVFVRDAKGRLDGHMEEYAEYLAERRLALKASPDETKALYQKYVADASSYGITTTQLIGDALPAATISKYLVETNLPMRWHVYRFPIKEAGKETIDSRPVLPPQPSPMIDMRGMKFILDGTPIERLGFMKAPYKDAPGTSGRANFTQERLDEFVGWAYGTEDPILMHVFGDAAMDMYVGSLERKGRAEIWKDKRPRIEHGDMMSPDLMKRVQALGVVVVQNPIHFTFTDAFKQRLSAERFAWMQPLKSMLAAGIPVAIGSDGPMSPGLNVMAASIHPTRPDEAITREQAVSAYTAGSAFAEHAEKDKGQLAVGKLADLAVLSKDLFTVPPDQMESIKSELTMIGGKIVFQTGVVH